MKKLLLLVIILIVASATVLAGCAKSTTTTSSTPVTTPTSTSSTSTPTSTTPGQTSTPTSTPTSTTTGPTPVYGGTLRIISNSGPQMLSYVPVMGPGDRSFIFPAAEALVDTTTERGPFSSGIEPVLAESYEVDPNALTITFNIRKGVYFSDGSELTSEVAEWNMQQVIDAGAMPYMDYFKDFRTPDDYTLIIDMTKFSNQMLPTWGWWSAMYSKKAWDDASGGDSQKGQDWARTHIVGTGPFILKDFQPDVSLTWVKNPNYWRPNRPYLDGINVAIIPDAVTARAAFEAGEGDIYAAPPKDAQQMIAEGYYEQKAWPVLPWGLWPNTANHDCKMYDLSLREAVEYAIDKAGVTQIVGSGMYQVIKALPIASEWGYDANRGRDYDPQKAKDLLTAAGYSASNPLKITILTTNAFGPAPIDACTMIKQNLDAVGFDTTLDVADAGRYFGTAYGKTNIPGANQDLLFYFAGGMDSNYLQTYIRWFSHDPFTWISFLGRTDEQIALDQQAMAAVDVSAQVAITSKLMDYMSNNCEIIPIYGATAYVIQQPYVHSTEYTQGFVRWQTEEVWMDKH